MADVCTLSLPLAFSRETPPPPPCPQIQLMSAPSPDSGGHVAQAWQIRELHPPGHSTRGTHGPFQTTKRQAWISVWIVKQNKLPFLLDLNLWGCVKLDSHVVTTREKYVNLDPVQRNYKKLSPIDMSFRYHLKLGISLHFFFWYH